MNAKNPGVGVVGAAATLLVTVACGPATPYEPGPLHEGDACPWTVMRRVNDHWLATHAEPGGNKWARAVYFMGDMAAFETLGEPAYLEYALRWATANDWAVHGGAHTRDADDHAAGQTYLALHDLHTDPLRIAAISAAVGHVVNSEERGDWSWIDAIFMAAPVFAGLGRVSGDPHYVAAMAALYEDTKVRRGLYDPEAGLWYRDESYRYPVVVSLNGEKEFWSRGNGWVIGALVRILEQLPADSPHRPEFVGMLQTMAAALAEVQREDGFWNVSLHDPDDHGGRETSGTALFTYAIAWGVRAGYLEPEVYEPVVERAWLGMVRHAVGQDGRLGYVQGVGESPRSAQPVTFDSTTDFGVGVFLLAGSQVDALDLELGCAGSASRVGALRGRSLQTMHVSQSVAAGARP